MTQPELRQVDSRPVPSSRGELRASLIVRNESLRLPAVLDHHRKLGVGRFFIVDNGSDDGTLDLLLAQNDVHVFWTDAPFRSRKTYWRRDLVRRFFDDVWGLHLDADELFFYPGMEQIDLSSFCAFLDEERAIGIFAPLVDMYGRESIERTPYRPGDSLLECYPFFDRDGYHLRFRGRSRRERIAPPFKVSGGPRERVFFAGDTPYISRMLAARFYDLRRRAPHPAARIPGLGAWLNSLARRGLPPYSPNLSKVPLLRWKPGLSVKARCFGSLHAVEPAIPLSACWATLLHFKFMPCLRAQVEESPERRRVDDLVDPEYERYAQVLRETDEVVLYGPRSTRFRSTTDLLEAGLMRRSPGLLAFLERESS